MILQAQTISSIVHGQLGCARRTGSVHSVFARTVNVLCEDSPGPSLWLSVHGPGVAMHPYAVRLDEAGSAAHGSGFLGARAGERVETRGGEIVLGGGRLTIRLGRAEVWNPLLEPLYNVLRPRGAGPGEAIREVLAGRKIRSPFLDCPGRTAGVEGALILRCRLIRSRLAEAWRRGDTGCVTRAMQAAVGLGSGLTPSGDDFLVGFLGAAHIFAYGCGVKAGLRRTISVKRSMTTLPSYFMLRGALAGFLPEPLSSLLRAIADDDLERTRDSAGLLAEVGAASGQDMLAGVICYLEATQTAGDME